ncbi:hypothetical protein N9E09_01845 [bacterium]|jgi:hypothetical protein|nr:hypothetical protein [bacterium]
MSIITDFEKSKPFVYELEWTDGLKFIYEQTQQIFAHLPNIYTRKPESQYYIDNYKEHYNLYDPDKPVMQVVSINDLKNHKELSASLEKYGFTQSLKFFQADPTQPSFKQVEHLFFSHRHHTKTSVASLIFPIAGCDEHTLTSWPDYEDVDGYIPDDPSTDVYWSEYYWKTYKKDSDKYLLSDNDAACRYALTDKPALWNVKQWHEAHNKGNKHRVICNINFKSNTQTWQESIDIVREI